MDAAIERATAALVNERSVRRLNENSGPHKRKLWALVRSLRREPRAVPVIRMNDRPLVTAAEKCEALADHYLDISSMATSRRSSAFDDRVRHHIDEIHLTPLAEAGVRLKMRLGFSRMARLLVWMASRHNILGISQKELCY